MISTYQKTRPIRAHSPLVKSAPLLSSPPNKAITTCNKDAFTQILGFGNARSTHSAQRLRLKQPSWRKSINASAGNAFSQGSWRGSGARNGLNSNDGKTCVLTPPPKGSPRKEPTPTRLLCLCSRTSIFTRYTDLQENSCSPRWSARRQTLPPVS